MTNRRLASLFERIADLLEEQDPDGFRVRAWRLGAQGLRDFPEEMAEVFRDRGRVGLEAVPHIGPHLTGAIIELLRTGRSTVLDRLRGETTPGATFAHLPGIGPELAARIHDQLGIETFEELEVAAHDGRLATVRGFGPRRLASVRDLLATRLANRPRRVEPDDAGPAPPVELLLTIDRRYREAAAAGTLRQIAPRRFNPTGEAWLPVLHGQQDGWVYTALFSNTALAHRLGRTHDWVIIAYHRPERDERRATVVTETHGAQRGRRVVRGREAECSGVTLAPPPRVVPPVAPVDLRAGTS